QRKLLPNRKRHKIYARTKIGQGVANIYSWEITWNKKLAGISKLFGKLFERFGRSSPFDSKLCHGTFDYHVVKDMEYR
ncbi:hypothetical protein Tco_0483288, partial [Tanacetum coccineum]